MDAAPPPWGFDVSATRARERVAEAERAYQRSVDAIARLLRERRSVPEPLEAECRRLRDALRERERELAESIRRASAGRTS